MFGYQLHTAVHPTVKAEFRICSRQVLTKETTTRAYWFEHVKTGHKSDPVTGIGQPDTEKAALAWLRALPARETPVTHTVTLRTKSDVNRLSYYTICKLADSLGCVYPMNFIPRSIELGKNNGVLLTVDTLGNYVSHSIIGV